MRGGWWGGGAGWHSPWVAGRLMRADTESGEHSEGQEEAETGRKGDGDGARQRNRQTEMDEEGAREREERPDGDDVTGAAEPPDPAGLVFTQERLTSALCLLCLAEKVNICSPTAPAMSPIHGGHH